MTVLLVALGAAVGAPLRYLTDRWMRVRLGDGFPWGTLAVNVAGSLLLGFLVGLPVGPRVAALLGTGFCGALTTYSTFALGTVGLVRRRAVLYAAASVVAGLTAAYLGRLAADSLTG